jgi:hypothetical protein
MSRDVWVRKQGSSVMRVTADSIGFGRVAQLLADVREDLLKSGYGRINGTPLEFWRKPGEPIFVFHIRHEILLKSVEPNTDAAVTLAESQ